MREGGPMIVSAPPTGQPISVQRKFSTSVAQSFVQHSLPELALTRGIVRAHFKTVKGERQTAPPARGRPEPLRPRRAVRCFVR